MLYNFEWNIEKEKQNNRKHKISFVRATTVFRDPNHISVFDEEHSANEDRWITLGVDKNGVYLLLYTLSCKSIVMSISVLLLRVEQQKQKSYSMRNLINESRIRFFKR